MVILPKIYFRRWIPGCGISLLVENNCKFLDKNNNFPKLSIYTKSGELNAKELLAVFMYVIFNINILRYLIFTRFSHFSNLPEYSESPFVASMETALLKMGNVNYSETSLNEGEDHNIVTEKIIEPDEG